jgi:ubiquinone/menaquinone biosynthesis C-methylase UbiE
MNINEKQKAEIEFYKNSIIENPYSDSLYNIVLIMSRASTFLDCIEPYKDIFSKSKNILEIGSGQGWASCIIKREYPNNFIVTTDISPYAVKSIDKWEHIFNVKIDKVKACTSYETGEIDSSFDIIFCYAAAHHFLMHESTLKEICRLLKTGGHCFWFYEPSTRAYLYKLAYWRVNKKRLNVPEDVLIYKKIKKTAESIGLQCNLDFYKSFKQRLPIETLYYYFLSKIPLLEYCLPCTINYHFVKY